jgi:predicted LPLAT superfamily acyltransferase
VFSILFIVVLSVAVFRSVVWIPYLGASLGVAALTGGLALWLLFDEIHVMTLVFGTTVLGLVVDYSFHWLLHGADERRNTVRNLLLSFVTTQISLLPLMTLSIPVLRQSAVFLGAGLSGALVYVLFCYPRRAAAAVVSRAPVRLPFAGMAVAILLGVSAAGWWRVSCRTDLTSLYRPEPALAETERLFADLSGGADPAKGFVVTAGAADLETLLMREEALNLPPGTPRLSRFLPSRARRCARAALVRKLYDEHGARQAALLGTGTLVPPPAPAAWTWRAVPAPLASAFVRDRQLVISSVLPPDGTLPQGCVFCRPRQTLSEMLARWTDETRLRLIAALALMFAVLVAVRRAGAVPVLAPSVIALVSVLGLMGLCGAPVTLFHLLACFLLLGMGVDYTVFLRTSGRAALKPALCSLLTSVAGFGALTFVSFPVVRAFGVVLGVGLPLSFLCALATAPRRSDATEHAASPVGLEALFLVYRLFGLRVLHAGAAAVGLTVWLCSPAVRRAAPSWRTVVAFTRSLADKLVVMAEGRRLPTVETDGSADARAFLADVSARRGVFVLSSHCGTIEALAALGACDVTFHAWMEFSRTSVFNAFYLRHARRRKVVIHPISAFGPETVFFAGDALDAGDCLVMAGDRGFGRLRRVPFRGGEISLPEGVFRFARVLAHPVYFVACVATGVGRYRAIVRRLPSQSADTLAHAYAAALDEVTRAYPEQWFKWEGGENERK